MIRPVRRARLGLALASAALMAAAAQPLAAQQASDPAGDFLPTYGGTKGGDLDVLSAQVFYDPTIQKFALTATMNGAIGSTPNGFYVWGFNKGAGAAGFASLGLNGILFDAVVLIRPTGVTVGGANVNDFFFFQGNTFTAVVPLSFLPSTRFTPQNYTWNLWPRQSGPTGTAQISDFAPDNSNFGVTVGPIPAAVLTTPEPGSMALMAAGIAGLGVVARRRRR
jgi:hypothetical protein